MVFVNASREDQPGRGNTLDGATGRTVSAVGLFCFGGSPTAGSRIRAGPDVIGGDGAKFSGRCLLSAVARQLLRTTTNSGLGGVVVIVLETSESP